MNNAKDQITQKLNITRAHLNLMLQAKKNASFTLAQALSKEVGGKVEVWITGSSQDRSNALVAYAAKKKIAVSNRRGRPSK